jgi:DNA adenine methylase
LFPAHKSYLEPFFGSVAVLFNKPSSSIETVNDLNDDVVNLFQVIQATPKELSEKLFLTPYSRTVYNRAWGLSLTTKLTKQLILLFVL